ncbi:MAG: stage II sporulation protein M [Nanoarchaeota archaeon]
MKTRRNKIVRQEGKFRVAWNYLKESRNYVYFSAGLFLVFALFGFFYSSHLVFLDEVLKGLIEKTKDLQGTKLIWFIFQNNLSSAFFTLFLGLFLAIFPLFNVGVNGVLLGYVFAKVYSVSGFSDFWRVLPHGIFELPAIFIAIGLGFKLGGVLFSKNLKNDFKERVMKSFWVFLCVILPLLIVAAIIEGLLISYIN